MPILTFLARTFAFGFVRIRLTILSAAMFALLAATSYAAPINYHVSTSIASTELIGFCGSAGGPPCFTYTLEGTLTTDGFLGIWTSDHFTNIQLTLSDGTNSVLLDRSDFVESGTIIVSTTDVLGVGPPFQIRFFDSVAGTSSWRFCSTQRGGCWQTGLLASNGLSVENRMSDFEPQPVGWVFARVAPVPEPSTTLLIGLGLGGMAVQRRRA